MRVLVCGGRDYSDWWQLSYILDHLETRPTVVISGCAKGADTLAIQWALAREVEVEYFPADWRTHGMSAGPIRNRQMLDEGKPDLVVAFPGGKGTAHMVKIAKAAGVPVQQVGTTIQP